MAGIKCFKIIPRSIIPKLSHDDTARCQTHTGSQGISGADAADLSCIAVHHINGFYNVIDRDFVNVL